MVEPAKDRSFFLSRTFLLLHSSVACASSPERRPGRLLGLGERDNPAERDLLVPAGLRRRALTIGSAADIQRPTGESIKNKTSLV